MSVIQKAFENKKIFIPFVTAGYPNREKFIQIVKALEESGAGIIEIGIPFSDPLADGPTIQDSSHVVLEQGLTINDIFDMVKEIRETCTVPLVFMTYYNIVYHRGVEAFINEAKSIGVNGLIVPDLPPEDAEDVLSVAGDDFSVNFLTSVVTTEDRCKMVVDKTTGFIYFVSRLGVTGGGLSGVDLVKEKVLAIKSKTDKPVAVGFGVSSKEDAQIIYDFADGVIVGSTIIKFIQQHLNNENFIDELREYCKQFVI